MTVATDAVFEMPDDGDNEGPRASEKESPTFGEPDAGSESDYVDEENVPHPDLNLDETEN